jgi:hypothetical protein
LLKLTRPALLAVTVVRLNDCRSFGSFRVRAARGLNRIPFRRRVDGRPLPDGTYRMVVQPPGRTATFKVSAGKPTMSRIRRPRQASCSKASVNTAGLPVAGTARKPDRGSGSPLGALGRSVVDKGKSVARKGKALGKRFAQAQEDPRAVDPFLLVILGLLLLSSATLGSMLALQGWRHVRASRSLIATGQAGAGS